MKVLLLSKYGSNGASSRLRSYQYIPLLREQQIEVVPNALFGNAYLRAMYARSPVRAAKVLSGYLRRVISVCRSREFDAVWLEKELFPWVPYGLERLLLPDQIPFVVDYDDAVFHRYDQSGNPLVRNLLGRKIDRIMGRADRVMVGNRYLEARAVSAGARAVIHVPTTIDVSRYSAGQPRLGRKRCTVGWIGTPYTAKYLIDLAPVLKKLYQTDQVEFRFIGCPAGLPLGVKYESVPWSEESEVAELQKLDCGIMPIPDSPFERGKCGYKLLQYMGCSIPVVASPVGVNAEIVKEGESGYLAASHDEWFDSIMTLARSAERRASMGEVGRRIVQESYASETVVRTIGQCLRDLAGDSNGGRSG